MKAFLGLLALASAINVPSDPAALALLGIGLLLIAKPTMRKRDPH